MGGVILLRILHIGAGVFWAGTIFFMARFLDPAIRATLPGSGVVSQELMKRNLMVILPITAIITLLSGIALYWRVSGHLVPGWIHTNQGMTLTVGGISAIVAFGFGILVMRPAQLRMMTLGPLIQKAEGTEKERMMNEVAALRRKATNTLRLVAVLLAVTVLAMAVARYV